MEINDIPKGSEEYFIKLSKNEFNGQFNMTFKFLCDLHKGYFPVGTEEIDAKLDALASNIVDINNRLDAVDSSTKKQTTIKMMNSREINVGGE